MTHQAPDIYFIDTNVWLYALIKTQDIVKFQRSQTLITSTLQITISTQVINEICVNLIKRKNFTAAQTREIITDYYARYPVIELTQTVLVTATHLREKYTFSYWDSLIVASALTSGASTLQSEDMHDGLIVEQQLTIVNPFK